MLEPSHTIFGIKPTVLQRAVTVVSCHVDTIPQNFSLCLLTTHYTVTATVTVTVTITVTVDTLFVYSLSRLSLLF